MTTTIHTLSRCVECCHESVLIDGRCSRCKCGLDAEAEVQRLCLEIGGLQADLAEVARQRDAAKARVGELLVAKDRQRAAIEGIKGHWGLLAIAQLNWTQAVKDLGGWEEVAQFVADMASKQGYGDAEACARFYQVEVVF